MGRVLAIDYGTKKVGLAVTDELKLIASALTTVPSHELFTFLRNYQTDNEIDCFVIGDAKKVDGSDSDIAKHVEKLKVGLKNKFPDIPIVMIDERFTSIIAKESILQSVKKKSKRQDKTIVDQVSATIILQSYLEQQESK